MQPTGLRPTLLKALQRSSTTPSAPASADDPNVGVVYSNGSVKPVSRTRRDVAGGASSPYGCGHRFTAPPPLFMGATASAPAGPGMPQPQPQPHTAPSSPVALGLGACGLPRPGLPGSGMPSPSGSPLNYGGTAAIGFGGLSQSTSRPAMWTQPAPSLGFPASGTTMATDLHASQPLMSRHLSLGGGGGSTHRSASSHSLSRGDGRELELLKRELKQANEKSNFFRSQVISLQQQLDAATTSPTSANHARRIAELEETLATLRKELRDERAEKQRLLLQTQHQSVAVTGAAALEAQLKDRDAELQTLRKALQTRSQEVTSLKAELQDLRQKSSFPSLPVAPSCSSSSMAALDLLGGGSQAHPSTSSDSAPFWNGDVLDHTKHPGGRRRALIVGCDYGQRAGALRGGVGDARQWARFFHQRCSLQPSDLRLVCDDPSGGTQSSSSSLMTAYASRSNILRGLQWLTARTVPGDQLFFVFCGLGCQVPVEEYAGKRLCECALVPADADPEGAQGAASPRSPTSARRPSLGSFSWRQRLVSDGDVHKAILQVPEGAQVSLIFDCCHAGKPLDRYGLDHLTEYVDRGRVDYDRLRGQPVRPRFLSLDALDLGSLNSSSLSDSPSGKSSLLRCRAVLWAACREQQFCVELPIEDQPRGAFTYILISALLKVGSGATAKEILAEAQALSTDLKSRWRLQQDIQLQTSKKTNDSQVFLKSP